MTLAKTILVGAVVCVSCLAFSGCSTTPPKTPTGFHSFKEFDKSVKISGIEKKATKSADRKKPSIALHPSVRSAIEKPVLYSPKLPFPYIVGESQVFTTKFSGVSAGELTLESAPIAVVNKRRAYHFVARLTTNKVFSLFFKMNDQIHLYYDREKLVPLTSTIAIEESKKLSETRTLYDWEKRRADEWENSVDNHEPLKQRRKQWDLPAKAQSLLSSIFFLRAHRLAPGTKIEFPVSHDEKNFKFRAEVIRKETVEAAGQRFGTFVIKASKSFTEIFNKKANGDALFWITDDEKRRLIQFEVPLRWGTLVGKLKSYSPGNG
jgi:hypothetical protein